MEPWPGGEGMRAVCWWACSRRPRTSCAARSSLHGRRSGIDNQTAIRLKKKLAEEFRQQLTIGAPTNQDEAGLRRLAAQIRAKKVVVKLFLRHPLHAKLYLLFRPDPDQPDHRLPGQQQPDPGRALRAGRAERGRARSATPPASWPSGSRTAGTTAGASTSPRNWSQIIEESWAREALIPPYHIYLKMAYHLSQEARAGLTEFRIPRDFGNRLFDFQTAAVKIAAHHLNKRGGVLIGDVVGLGKTLMATAVARIFEDDHGLETLIICPKNLVKMWEDYRDQYRLRGQGALGQPRCIQELPELRRYRLVMIDESHNLRNREGKRYRAIQEYIQKNESQLHPALGHALQQDLPRPLQPAAPVRARGQGPGHPARAAAARDGRDRVHPPPPVLAPLAGRLREERVRRRLARADAPVHGAAHAQLHPGQLRRDRPGDGRKYLTF